MIQSTRNTVNHPLQECRSTQNINDTINMNWFGRRVKTQLELIQTDSIECSIMDTKTAIPYTKQDEVNSSPTRSLEALSVDDSRTGIIILVLGDPHLLEGGQ